MVFFNRTEMKKSTQAGKVGHFRRTAIAGAVAAVLSPVALAQIAIDPPVQILIPQIVGTSLGFDYVLEQNALNTIVSGVENENGASVVLDLGVGNAGSSQFGSNQFFTIGWGQTGGSLATALDLILTEQDVDGQMVQGAAVIQQVITREQLVPSGSGPTVSLGGEFADIRQLVSNNVILTADVELNGLASINGLSQIGSNVANAAALNLKQGGTLALSQRVDAFDQTSAGGKVVLEDADFFYYGEDSITGLGGLEQVIQNVMIANLGFNNDEEIGAGGNAIIDGAYGENLSKRSTQFGSNAVNNAVIGIAAGTQGALVVNQSFGAASFFYGEEYIGTGTRYYDGVFALQGYRSSVTNVAIADAGNFDRMTLSYLPVPIDPVVRNLDQVAAFAGNALSLVVPAAADPSQASATLETGGQTFSSPLRIDYYNFGSTESLETGERGYAQVPFQLSNLIVASNGDWDEGDDYYAPGLSPWGIETENDGLPPIYGGRGDAIIEKVGQITQASINTVNITGPSVTTTVNGIATTTVADAGLTRVNQFNQTVNGLVSGSMWFPWVGQEGYRAYGIGSSVTVPQDELGYDSLAEDSASFLAFYNRALGINFGYQSGDYGGMFSNLAGGNLAMAYTGSGIAAVRDVNQVQSLTANAFSTTGSLQGIIDVGYQVSSSGAPEGTPSMRQAADGVFVQQGNAAVAFVEDRGQAMASGSQTLAFSLNSLTVGGTLSGNFEQVVSPAPANVVDEWESNMVVDQRNLMLAMTDNGAGNSVRIGDYAVNGTLVSSPVAQTIVSSINTMNVAALANATLIQRVENEGFRPITQNSVNMVVAWGDDNRIRTANLSNISQAVLNRVNTIATYTAPAAP